MVRPIRLKLQRSSRRDESQVQPWSLAHRVLGAERSVIVHYMRGAELGLKGQDLILYQMGEVVQIGVMIDKSLHKWIDDTQRNTGIPPEHRKNPTGFKPKAKLACILASRLLHYTDEEKEWMRGAFTDSRDAMEFRNRVVHDQWVSFDNGVITRFGYFAERDGFPADEIEPGEGPGQYSHQDWENLRTRLWHCYWRLSSLTRVQRYPPNFDYFFGHVGSDYAMVRGEFYLGRDYLVPWSWADSPPDFSAETPELGQSRGDGS